MAACVTFSGFSFNPETGRLWSGQEELRLTPKAAAVLKLLVQNAGQPVSKADLFASIWKDTAVTDDALTSCIQELRKALGDDAKQPRFIETRHRRGYRFAASVELEAPVAAPAPARAEVTVAVLPFADMSAARDQDYFCEGLAEELINALTNIEGLRVVSRTAAFQFRSSGGDVREIGRKLGVEHLLEGSVRKSGEQLRVTVQLIEVASGYHRWSQRFDRAVEDVFAIQDAIAQSVTASLRGSLLSQQERQAMVRPHTRSEAYDFYLRGRQHLPRMSEDHLKKSREMFAKAIELDASYSPAYAGLAMVHSTLYEWFGSKQEDCSAAERASQRALELTPDLAEAHVALGFALTLARRYEDASQEFEEAIRLAPTLFDAYFYYARACFASGRFEDSAEMFRKAAESRPEDYQSALLRSLPLRVLGRDEEARESAREGLRRAEHSLMLNPSDVRALSLGSCALYDISSDQALEWCRRALQLAPDDMSTLINAACLHAKLGLKQEAMNFVEAVFARGWGKRDWIEHDPDYEILRDDPRFKKLLAALK